MSVLKTISERTTSLPKTQRIVAQYILTNWEKASFESTMTIAAKLNVSQSTVIRMAINLGFSGFPDLQKKLQEYIENRISLVSRANTSIALTGEKNTEKMIRSVFQQHEKNLQQTLVQLDFDKVVEAADQLITAKRVYVLGMRTSVAGAHYLGFNLSMIRKDVIILSSDYILLENLRGLTAEDLLVVISFPRYTGSVVAATKIAYETKCAIIGITDEMTSPLVPLAGVSFIVPAKSTHFNVSYLSVIALIDVLLTMITAKNMDMVKGELEKIEDSIAKLNIFESKK